MLEESEGQGRLRGEVGDRGKESVRVSDGDRPQRTQDIFLKYLDVVSCCSTPERISLENAALLERRHNLRGPLKSLQLLNS